jgi:hypothetical protein
MKIGTKVVRHARYAIFHMVEVAVPKELFKQILRLIEDCDPDRIRHRAAAAACTITTESV